MGRQRKELTWWRQELHQAVLLGVTCHQNDWEPWFLTVGTLRGETGQEG